jgi:hypothetical protein
MLDQDHKLENEINIPENLKRDYPENCVNEIRSIP